MSRVVQSITAAIPYVLPVLGGCVGVAYVNLNPEDYVNPVLGIGLGVFLGWAISGVILHFLNRDH